MTPRFAEFDVIARNRAQVVLTGANPGTAPTALIVTQGIKMLSPILLLSLPLMTQATQPLRTSDALKAFLATHSAPPATRRATQGNRLKGSLVAGDG